MSNNFLRRDSCEHAFNREIANDTAKTTCCSIDPFGMFHNRNWLSVISRNLSSNGTSRSIAVDYRCLTFGMVMIYLLDRYERKH